jgi:predicted Zn-dependent peptidase
MSTPDRYRSADRFRLPPPLALERHRLDNGLEVVLHRDARLPLVALNLWYHVGSKNERPGHTGFAHLFEHMLFQGSENVGTNDHFHYVQQAGGVANGSTWYDRTNYYEVLPSSHLDLGLWLESDRMGFLMPAITQEKLDNQREVVINERRQKMDNQPYGRAFERLQEMLYSPSHPYRWPVIGYVEDVERATLDDVQDFFETFYSPDNAVLTLAGDFEPAQALERVAHFFDEIPPGPARPAVEAVRPRVEGPLREVQEDDVQLPRIYMAFAGPAYGERSWYAADLLATVLSDGKSSPLYRDLVYERELAKDVGVYVFPTEVAATFSIISTARPGVEPEVLEAALLEHFEACRRGPLPEAELERARSSLLTSHFSQLQTLERRADRISMFTTYFDAPEAAGREMERYLELGAEDVQEFARGYLDPAKRVVVTVVPRGKA